MVSVALIGPDGAGKTTISRRLQKTFPLPLKYLYMGVSRDASNRMLPTTYLIQLLKRAGGTKPHTGGPRDLDPSPPKATGSVGRICNPSNLGDGLQIRPTFPIVKRTLRAVKSALSLTNRIGEEWYRQLLAWSYQLRGHVVVFDRHYFADFYAYDIAQNGDHRPWSRRIHGWMLQRLYPKPDLVIYLDAPSSVLLDRKGEGTLSTLERRRRECLQMRHLVRHFEVVDANRPAEEVTRDVTAHILDFHRTKATRVKQP